MRLRPVVTALGTAMALLLAGAGAARGAGGQPGAGALLELAGEAFGTTWSVKLPVSATLPEPAFLAAEIDSVLARVDAEMSGWREDSHLSRFNASRSTEWWPVPRDLLHVVSEALVVHRLSGGAFDPTAAPLVALWGFGPQGPRRLPPSLAEVRAARVRVGAGGLAARRDPPALRKAWPDLSLDLSGVAKGFAVDAVTRRLDSLGLEHFLVEVGGELRGRGRGPEASPWRVGLERPRPGAGGLGWVVELIDSAVASSGDYRRFFAWEGRRYAHVIDPRSGSPPQHGLAAVSVLAPEAARADAWATALLVLGPEAGWSLALQEDLAVLFVHERGGRLAERATPQLERYRVP